jgi:cytoskeletal protein RodZ
VENIFHGVEKPQATPNCMGFIFFRHRHSASVGAGWRLVTRPRGCIVCTNVQFKQPEEKMKKLAMLVLVVLFVSALGASAAWWWPFGKKAAGPAEEKPVATEVQKSDAAAADQSMDKAKCETRKSKCCAKMSEEEKAQCATKCEAKKAKKKAKKAHKAAEAAVEAAPAEAAPAETAPATE